MNKQKVARELIKIAKKLQAKPEIDFQAVAEQIDELVDKIDDHINSNNNNYDRLTVSQIDKATRRLIDAKKILEDIEAWDEDPLGVVNRGF